MEQDDGGERGGLSGSSGSEFLCPDYGDDFPTLRRLKCHRGKAHGCGGRQLGSCATACAHTAASTSIAGHAPWRMWKGVREGAGKP